MTTKTTAKTAAAGTTTTGNYIRRLTSWVMRSATVRSRRNTLEPSTAARVWILVRLQAVHPGASVCFRMLQYRFITRYSVSREQSRQVSHDSLLSYCYLLTTPINNLIRQYVFQIASSDALISVLSVIINHTMSFNNAYHFHLFSRKIISILGHLYLSLRGL
jgi:hypothetical protein